MFYKLIKSPNPIPISILETHSKYRKMLIMLKILNISSDLCMLKTSIKIIKAKLKKFRNKGLNSLIVQLSQYKKWKAIII